MPKKSTRLEALQDMFQKNVISLDTLERNDGFIQAVKKYADAVPDYRHPSYIKHPLGDIIMIVFFAVLGNANEWAEIEAFAKKKEGWLRKYLDLPYGVPTDDTYRIVMGSIQAEHFFHVTTQLLLQTVNNMLALTEEPALHERSIQVLHPPRNCRELRNKKCICQTVFRSAILQFLIE